MALVCLSGGPAGVHESCLSIVNDSRFAVSAIERGDREPRGAVQSAVTASQVVTGCDATRSRGDSSTLSGQWLGSSGR